MTPSPLEYYVMHTITCYAYLYRYREGRKPARKNDEESSSETAADRSQQTAIWPFF